MAFAVKEAKVITFEDIPVTASFGKVCISGAWKTVTAMKIAIGGVWKTVTAVSVSVSHAWKGSA